MTNMHPLSLAMTIRHAIRLYGEFRPNETVLGSADRLAQVIQYCHDHYDDRSLIAAQAMRAVHAVIAADEGPPWQADTEAA